MIKEYDNYKNSNIEWIGIIPEHWIISKAKNISSFRMGQTITKEELIDDGKYPVYSATEGDHYFGRINDPIFLLKEGDIVIPARGNSIGYIAFVFEKSVSTQTTIANFIDKSKINSKFLYYYYRGHRKELFFYDNTAIPQITVEQVKNNPVLLPSIVEQSQIANYLDHQTALIDEIINRKEKQIELLKEKRKAIINELVTKGLDTNALMKDSGIEWLGEIPEHWNTIKLKYLIDALESGVSVNSEGSPIDFKTDEIGVLKTSCVFGYCFNPHENKKVVDEEISRVKCPVRANSIIISRMNTPELVGASGFVDKNHENLFLPDRLWQTVFKEDIKFDVEFISYVLISETYKELYETLATGTSPSMKNISQSSILEIPIPELPLEEQVSIKNTIKSKKRDIERIIELQIESVDKLREYRQSIITEAVTGKIDVRDWHPNNA